MKHIPRKRFGQHFLSDQGIIDGIEVLRAAAEAEEQRAALLEATSDERSAPTADTATPTDTATTADESSDDEVTAS